jgi:hypothetical protein
MSNYPYQLDDNTSIFHVSDQVTQISGTNFNQARDAIFKIQRELGILPSGTQNNLADFLNVSHNSDGSIRAAALTAVGLVTLPIDNAQVGVNAGILESKLALDFSTSSLYTLVTNNASAINAIQAATTTVTNNLSSHIGGGPSANLRHVGSHIDLNAVPNDFRDPTFFWDGLNDTNGNQRTAENVAEGLQQINDELVFHQNRILNAHNAEAIFVDTSNFSEIPAVANNVQLSLEALDASEALRLGTHRATQHSAGIPNDSRSPAIKVYDDNGDLDVDADGYGNAVVPTRAVITTVAANPGTAPIDSIINGDDIIRFVTPSDINDVYILDSQFSQVRPGDVIRVNYGDGYGDGYVENQFYIESVRFVPGVEWVVRINGNNLYDIDTGATARIDRPLWDPNIQNVMAAAAANATPLASFTGQGFLGSLTIADPRSAMALGIGFDAGQLDNTHYNLYLQIYPTGRPSDRVITLPGIDVTGNLGATPGEYTLENIVESTNNSLRSAGYNLRFLAFSHNGNFGISMTDAINGAAFSIVNGDNSTGTLTAGSFPNNAIGDATDGFDALGLGMINAGHASPAYQSSFVDSTAALLPTKIFMPRRKAYIVNGTYRDFIRSATNTLDGYYNAEITSRVVSGSTVEVTYTIQERLDSIGLKAGKTITIQPELDFSDGQYSDVDYGRFMIKNVVFLPTCPGDPDCTAITVINGIHGSGNPTAFSSLNIPVRVYVGGDSVTFNLDNVIDPSLTGLNYHRLHEVYATKESKTFSHERGRLPVQEGTGSLLATSNWHISDISTKFRGDVQPGGNGKRFTRFYVLNYNLTSGEYDGYLGTPNFSNSNVSQTGPIATGRKNVPTRFYDKTGLDYIDLTYVETSNVGTPTTINAPRYVDIEIFPTLALNDEFLRLATAEINWQPPAGQYIVERVIDRRPIGSISELEFTQSAKNYINAGEKYLHENGVIRGLELQGIDSSDNGLLTFKGGLALVDGTFSTINNGSVKIPEIINNGGPSTLDWAICVNAQGKFETIPLTMTKMHFFALRAGNPDPYYIPSVTLEELATSRKDLTLIYVANVTVSSVVVNSVSDARKFVVNESSNIPLSISDNPELGIFTSFEQLVTWCTHSSRNIIVKVKGTVTVNSEVDLRGISNLTLEDGGGTIVVNSTNGLLITSGVSIKGVRFVYNASVTSSDPLNNSNLDLGLACINISGAAENIVIDGCEFRKPNAGDRAPYVAGFLTTDDFSNINIINNKFYESANSYNCAVGFYTPGTDTRNLTNLNVDHNIVYGRQSILIVRNTTGGIVPLGCSVSNNNMNDAIIGVRTNITDITYLNSSLKINSNRCYAIFNATTFGRYTDTTLGGSYIATQNVCRAISLCSSVSLATINISNNIIHGETELLSGFDLNNLIAGIRAISNSVSFIFIDNNSIMRLDSTTGVSRPTGISASSGNITNNRIWFRNIGIELTSGRGSITGNYLIPNAPLPGLLPERYISITSVDKVICTENNLSGTQVIGPSFETITYDNNAHVVDRNVNHYNNIVLDNTFGEFGIGAGPNASPSAAYAIFTSSATPSLFLSGTSSKRGRISFTHLTFATPNIGFSFKVHLRNILPPGAKFISCNFDGSWLNGSASVNGRIMLVRSDQTILQDSGLTSVPTAGTPVNISITGTQHSTDDAFIFAVMVVNSGGGSSTNGTVTMENLTLTYTF